MKAVLKIGLILISVAVANAKQQCPELLSFSANKLGSSEVVDFCEFAGKPVLVVNTASKCRHTSQFEGLEELHKFYEGKVVIVGFPSNDFKREHSDSARIQKVCQQNYGVSFTMLTPSKVRGKQANKLFKKLAETTGKHPRWNFNKYLISPDGKTVQYYPSKVKPTMLKLEIDKQL